MTNKSIKKKIETTTSKMKTRPTMIWLRNTPSYSNRERKKRPMLPKPK